MSLPSAAFGPGLRYGFLVNPVSGSGRGRRVYDELPSVLDELGLPRTSWTRELTSSSGVPEQACRILSECDRLVVAGGDGTAGQAMEGLRRSGRSDAALGLIPLGTGNDLARELRLLEGFQRRGLPALLSALLEDRVVPLDLWDVGGRTVLANYLSFGVDGWITEVFGRSRQLVPGHRRSTAAIKFGYARAGLGSLLRRLPPDFRIEAQLHDGEAATIDLGTRKSLIALNVGSYASGMLRPVRTRADDGVLNLVCIPSLHHYWMLLATAWLPRLQAVVQRRHLPMWQVSRFTATWSGRNALQVDGEGRRDLLSDGRLEVTFAGKVRMLSGRPAA